MNRHLVAVEVGVESSTDKRMKLDGLTFDQNRLECLNAEAVQGRRTVEHNRMLADDILENVPDFRLKTLHHLLRVLDIMADSSGNQLLHHKRLKQLDRHLLGKTALIDLQLRSHDDNRTA